MTPVPSETLPLFGDSSPSRQRSNVVLPDPLLPRIPHRWPRSISRLSSLKQGQVVRFAELLGPQYDVATARHGGKLHRRGLDRARRRYRVDPLQFLATIFRLRVLLAIPIAANEVLQSGDLGLLILVGPTLEVQPLRLLLPVGCEVAAVRHDRAPKQLQAAIGDSIQEETVVADHDQRLSRTDQVVFQPRSAFDVQVVGRFVQQHQVGCGQQELGQHQSVLLSTAQYRHLRAKRGRRETHALQYAFNPVIEVVGVLSRQFLLQSIETLLEIAPLLRIFGLANRFRQPLGLVRQLHQVLKRHVGLIPDRTAA